MELGFRTCVGHTHGADASNATHVYLIGLFSGIASKYYRSISFHRRYGMQIAVLFFWVLQLSDRPDLSFLGLLICILHRECFRHMHLSHNTMHCISKTKRQTC